MLGPSSEACPNCGHRFFSSCYDSAGSVMIQTSIGDQFSSSCKGSYCNGNDYLLPRGYLNGGRGGCKMTVPKIIQGQNDAGGIVNSRWIQQQQQQKVTKKPQAQILSPVDRNSGIPAHCQIDATGCGGVSIANKKSDQIEESSNPQCGIFQNPHPMLLSAPSGCQELPGLGETGAKTESAFNFQISEDADWTKTKNVESSPSAVTAAVSNSFGENCTAPSLIHVLPRNGNNSVISSPFNNSKATSPAGNATTVIQVNATLQLPPNVAHCTVSITATANTMPSCNRARNNFNGGGIVESDSFGNVGGGTVCDRDDNSPTTPVSWVLPFPWGVNGNTGGNSTDLERLSAAQKVLQISGWYHEGLSWQQSAALLNNATVGSWLMRDSSDKRFMYAVSVQTARGPTAVRVHYVCGKFRLDAEPRMAPFMPMFDCPVKMIEHYIEYSKKMSEQKEVWVDHSGQLYSQIYLTKPLLKSVRSLSHIARLAVNKSNISTKVLPPLLREYIAEYPYTE